METRSNFLSGPDFDKIELDFDGVTVEPEPKPIDLPGITALRANDPDNLSLLVRNTQDVAPFMYVDPVMQTRERVGAPKLGVVDYDPAVMPKALLIKRNPDPDNAAPSSEQEYIANILVGERARLRILNDAPNIIPSHDKLTIMQNILLGKSYNMRNRAPFQIGRVIKELFPDMPVNNLVLHPEYMSSPVETSGPAAHGRGLYNPMNLTGHDMAPSVYQNVASVPERSLHDLSLQSHFDTPKHMTAHSLNSHVMDKLAPMFHQ